MSIIGFCIKCRRNTVPLVWRFASRPDTGVCLECYIPKIAANYIDAHNGIVVDGKEEEDREDELEGNREKYNEITSELKPRHYRRPYKPPSKRQSTLFKFLPKEVTSRFLNCNEFISNVDDLRATSMKRLINDLISCNLEVPEDLAREVARRDDSLNYLRAIFENDEYWRIGGPGDGWTPIHAIHILALKGTNEALNVLLDVLRFKANKIGDFLTENVPTLLAAFGEAAIKKLGEFVRDEKVDKYSRNSAATALTILGHQHPALASEVLCVLLELVSTTTDAELATFQVDDVLSFKNPTCLPVIKNAIFAGRIDPYLIGWEDVIEIFNQPAEKYNYIHFIRDPAEHFSEENRAYLRKVNYPKPISRPIPEPLKNMPPRERITNQTPKIGRNQPCPCGSGKKYKYCCLAKKRARKISP